MIFSALEPEPEANITKFFILQSFKNQRDKGMKSLFVGKKFP